MSQSRSISCAASSVNRFHWSEGILNRYYVRIRHEHRIIYRVGTPCFDLIISNKSEMVVSRFLVSAWLDKQRTRTLRWRTNRWQGRTKTRKEFLPMTMIDETQQRRWWEKDGDSERSKQIHTFGSCGSLSWNDGWCNGVGPILTRNDEQKLCVILQ